MDISAEIAAIQAASQGSELRQPLVGALNKLNSGSLPAVTASDAGKILKVGANGWEVGEKSGYMPVPTDTMQIADNGTYDVTNYASAQVYVSGGGSSTLIPKTITQNGTYDPVDDNADGYSSVIVNVEDELVSFKNYIQSNGTQYIDTGYIVKNTTQIECIADIVDDNITHCLFGTRGVASGEANAQACLVYIGGKDANRYKLYTQFTGKQDQFDGILNGYLGHKVMYRLNRGHFANLLSRWVVHGDSVSTSNTPATTQYPLYLLVLNNCGVPGNEKIACKLYLFRVFEGDTIVHEFIPWIDSNDVVCLKDNITGNIKYNSGTGVFNYGTDSNS